MRLVALVRLVEVVGRSWVLLSGPLRLQNSETLDGHFVTMFVATDGEAETLGSPVPVQAKAMPVALRIAMVLGGFFGVVGSLVGGWAMLRLGLSDGPFLFDGVAVSKARFLRVALPFLSLYVVASLTAGTAALALRRRSPRSRMLLLGLLGELVIGDAAMLTWMRYNMEVGALEIALSSSFFAALVAGGLWYLFRKKSVVDYYGSLRFRA